MLKLLFAVSNFLLDLQRFKEMKELHGSSSRDDRLKREQQRQEREMAKYAQLYPRPLFSLSFAFSFKNTYFVSEGYLVSFSLHVIFNGVLPLSL